MYGKPSKKTLPFFVLEILKKYTDEEHRLSQAEIGKILEREYDFTSDRKTIKRALSDLEDLGYDIEYSEIKREYYDSDTKEMQESYILSDFYLVPEFTDGELKYLIDLISSSGILTKEHARGLVSKLEKQSNKYFKSTVSSNIHYVENRSFNKQILYLIEEINWAIKHGKTLTFNYLEDVIEAKPEALVLKCGTYYLCCETMCGGDTSKYQDTYVMDKIKNLSIAN